MTDWHEEYMRGQIVKRVLPQAQTPGERRFKMAFFSLLVDGIYPSGRQVYNRIGKVTTGKVNLNGRECQWLAEMREMFGIEPYIGYTPRKYRADWHGWIHGEHGGPKFPYKMRRGPKGTLVVCEEYIDNRRADQKAALRQEAIA